MIESGTAAGANEVFVVKRSSVCVCVAGKGALCSCCTFRVALELGSAGKAMDGG